MQRRPPLYHTVADNLRRLIVEGKLQRGNRLPGEDDLARELSVGRSTIREALHALEQNGLVIRRHGIGNFVSRNFDRMRGNLEILESFATSIRRSGYEVRTESLGVDIGPVTPSVAAALELPPEIQVCHIDILDYGNGLPAILSRTSLPLAPGEAAPQIDLTSQTSVREHLIRQKGIKVSYAFLTVSAVVAEADVARYLGKESGDPLLLLEGPAYTEDGTPVYHTSAWFNTSVYQFNLVRRSQDRFTGPKKGS